MDDEVWVDITTLGSSYEVQVNLAANGPAYRHRWREMRGEDEIVGAWRPGKPPKDGGEG